MASKSAANPILERLPALQQELAVATELFTRADREKQAFLSELGGHPTIKLEHRQHFLNLLKAEQQAYHKIQAIQQRILELLREASNSR